MADEQHNEQLVQQLVGAVLTSIDNQTHLIDDADLNVMNVNTDGSEQHKTGQTVENQTHLIDTDGNLNMNTDGCEQHKTGQTVENQTHLIDDADQNVMNVNKDGEHKTGQTVENQTHPIDDAADQNVMNTDGELKIGQTADTKEEPSVVVVPPPFINNDTIVLPQREEHQTAMFQNDVDEQTVDIASNEFKSMTPPCIVENAAQEEHQLEQHEQQKQLFLGNSQDEDDKSKFQNDVDKQTVNIASNEFKSMTPPCIVENAAQEEHQLEQHEQQKQLFLGNSQEDDKSKKSLLHTGEEQNSLPVEGDSAAAVKASDEASLSAAVENPQPGIVEQKTKTKFCSIL